ncbi:hypothetical protein DL98DRAFT_17669 [Cadophora sp. DSE1049]|nr:hypothetical protein DL98DRAFT_17669 [Cadophora sp. DSE1049]
MYICSQLELFMFVVFQPPNGPSIAVALAVVGLLNYSRGQGTGAIANVACEPLLRQQLFPLCNLLNDTFIERIFCDGLTTSPVYDLIIPMTIQNYACHSISSTKQRYPLTNFLYQTALDTCPNLRTAMDVALATLNAKSKTPVQPTDRAASLMRLI